MSSSALYLQLSSQLIRLIETDLKPGDYLPSERDLVEEYDLSRTTVRAALHELESLGYIARLHGKGSLVLERQHHPINLASLYSFSEKMESFGRDPSNQILAFEFCKPEPAICKALKLTPDDKVIYFKRLRLADGRPMLLEETYLPAHLFKGLSQEDLISHNFYDLVEQDYHLEILYAQEEFCAGLMSEEAAHYLESQPQTPCLHINRQTYNQDRQVIEYTSSIARADQFVFKTIHHKTQ